MLEYLANFHKPNCKADFPKKNQPRILETSLEFKVPYPNLLNFGLLAFRNAMYKTNNLVFGQVEEIKQVETL